MKTPLLSFLVLLLFLQVAYAQQSPEVTSREVFGTVADSTGLLPGVKIKLISAKDSVVMVTNQKGLTARLAAQRLATVPNTKPII